VVSLRKKGMETLALLALHRLLSEKSNGLGCQKTQARATCQTLKKDESRTGAASLES